MSHDILSRLPEDLVSHVVGYLAAPDFYRVKTALSCGLRELQRDSINCIWWWREEVGIERAAAAQCASLVRWVAAHDTALSADEVVSAAAQCHTAAAGRAVFAAAARWPAVLPELLAEWAAAGNTEMFEWQIALRPATATATVFDQILTAMRWDMLATAFHYSPRAFVAWAFSGYTEVADPEVITTLRAVMQHLTPRDRQVLRRILEKYHAWLWRTKLTRVATLQTIVAIQSLEVVPFEPARHLEQALESPHHIYLEYLLMRGVEVTPETMRRTHDLRKLRLIATAQLAQKYQQIMVMLFVIIFAVIASIMRGTSVVVPKLITPRAKIA